MSSEHLDPDVGLGHQVNAAVLAVLRAQAVPSTDPSPSAWHPAGYEPHTHSDLEERLSQLASSLPEHRSAMLYGCPVLASKGSVVFAVACGLRFLAFRLAEADIPLAVELGGEPARALAQRGRSPVSAGLEANWIVFDPWGSALPSRKWTGDLTYFCEQAFRHALSID